MKNICKLIGLIAFITIIGFSACKDDDGGGSFEYTGPVPLTAGQWRNGEITDPEGSLMYTFIVSQGSMYNIWLNHRTSGDGTKTLAATTSITYENGAEGSYALGSLIITAPGRVIIEVKGLESSPFKTGTFAIAYTIGLESIRPDYPPLNPPNQIALTENTWSDGDILNPGDMHWYTFDVTAGQTYYVWWNGGYSGIFGTYGNGTKTLDISASAYYNNGTSIFSNVNNGWSNSRTITPTSNGKVFIRITPYSSSGGTGTYGITYNTNGTRPSTLNTSGAIPLEQAQWSLGTITASNQALWYSVTAATPGTHRIWWNDAGQGNGSATVDVEVSAWRANEATIFTNIDSAWNTDRTVSLNTSGETIYIRVTPKTQGATGTFNIVYHVDTVRPWLAPTNAAALTASTWADGTITSTVETWYSMNVTSGQTYNVWLNTTGTNGDYTKSLNVRAQIYDGVTGTQLLSNPNNLAWSAPQSFTATSNGTVFVRVYPNISGQTGTFGIVFTANESVRPVQYILPGTVNQLTAGQWTNGEISTGGEVWYSITAASTVTHHLWWNDSLAGNGDKNLDVVVSVWHANGNAWVTDNNLDSAWSVSRNATITSGATVYIRVTPKNAGAAGTFAIGYNTSNSRPWLPPANATALTENQWVDGNIFSTTVSEKWYSFNVTNGQTYYVWWNDTDVSGTSKSLDVVASAFYENGSLVTASFNNADIGWGTPQNFTPASNSTVYIRITPRSSGNFGTFGVVFSTNSTRPQVTILPADITTSAIPLTFGEWTRGQLTSSVKEIWYSVTPASTDTHRFWWNDLGFGSGSATVDVIVSAYRADETVVFAETDSAWTNPRSPWLAFNEPIYIKVIPKNPGAAGTFDIVYSTASTRPLLDSQITPLTAGVWVDAIKVSGEDSWFSFNVTNGETYYVWWNDSWQGNSTKTADVYVYATYKSNGTSIFENVDSGWNTPRSFTSEFNDTVYLRVNQSSGTFGIVYSTTNTRPAVP